METIELLAYEETRRRLSIDFTHPPLTQAELLVDDGVVVPLTVLTKEPRRNFDPRDRVAGLFPSSARRRTAPWLTLPSSTQR